MQRSRGEAAISVQLVAVNMEVEVPGMGVYVWSRPVRGGPGFALVYNFGEYWGASFWVVGQRGVFL